MRKCQRIQDINFMGFFDLFSPSNLNPVSYLFSCHFLLFPGYLGISPFNSPDTLVFLHSVPRIPWYFSIQLPGYLGISSFSSPDTLVFLHSVPRIPWYLLIQFPGYLGISSFSSPDTLVSPHSAPQIPWYFSIQLPG